MPAAVAASAKIPYGVSWTMKRVAAGDRRAGHAEHVEQHFLALDADQGNPEDDREQHDRRDDVVRERIERIRGNVEADEVERWRLLRPATR